MHATFYADPSIVDGSSTAQPRSKKAGLPRSPFRGFFSFGRAATRDPSVEMLSDHMLHDIGISRADLCALKL